MNKAYLREKYRKIRAELSPESRHEKSRKISERFFETDAFKTARTVMCYSAITSEVDTSLIADRLFKEGKTVLLPVCDEADGIMHASQLKPSDTKTEGKFGIGEPSDKTEFEEKIDLVIVPAIAFDKKGRRIGYGKGYYDRFLEKHTESILIGLCYTECITKEDIDTNEYDIAVNCIITDGEVIRTKNE